MRVAAVIAFAFAASAYADPAPFTVLSDTLDANAPAAELPAGPVDAALAELAREQPQAKVLVPRRLGEQGGQRYALAAWRSALGAKDWDAILVVATPEGARIVEVTSTAKDYEGVLTALVGYGTSATPPATTAGRGAPVVKRSDLPSSQAASAQGALDPLPMPTSWDQRFVVIYSRDPAYHPGDAAAEAALTDAHVQYTLRLQQDGTALAAGPFEDEAAPEAPIGMTLLRVRDLAAAERIARADPAVVAGRLRVTVRPWKVPAGQLP